MNPPSRNCHSEERRVDVPGGLSQGGACLVRYLLETTQRLETITDRVRRGQTLESDTRDWMLAQVDFVVTTLGDESLQLGEELRSKLLELLLALTNLNEYVRRQASAATPTR